MAIARRQHHHYPILMFHFEIDIESYGREIARPGEFDDVGVHNTSAYRTRLLILYPFLDTFGVKHVATTQHLDVEQRTHAYRARFFNLFYVRPTKALVVVRVTSLVFTR